VKRSDKRKELAKEKAEREAEIKRLKDQQAELRQREQEELQKRLLEEETQRRAAAVERAAAERTTTVKSKYSALMEQAVKRQWIVPPGTEPWRKARVNIKLSPRGEVQSVRVVESSGSPAFDKSAETAVLQASPLPLPTPQEDQIAHEQMQNVIINITK